MIPAEPVPVKLICGILFSDAARLEAALEALTARYGAVDYRSPLFPFTITRYYDAEMGGAIQRLFVSFTPLISPGALAEIKIACNALEADLAVAGLRKVNLDPGYMDYDKLVLASAKYNAHKIYLDLGIYADPTLRYEKGAYLPAPWAFPDFKSGQYNETFLRIRARYKGQLRRQARTSSPL
ncbi:MAG TPA: DUF4416 family protein [bacterium]|nr:DUF4416 family protein [bacterium]HPR88228.1 DUF4416 family protein [bacterium]